MRLSLILLALYVKLATAAKTNQAFKGYIGNIKLKILIKTANNAWGRLFVFDGGKVSSLNGANHSFDAALIWSDSGTAFRVMLKGTDEAVFKAAAAGKVRVEGMSYFIQWFNDGIKLVM